MIVAGPRQVPKNEFGDLRRGRRGDSRGKLSASLSFQRLSRIPEQPTQRRMLMSNRGKGEKHCFKWAHASARLHQQRGPVREIVAPFLRRTPQAFQAL